MKKLNFNWSWGRKKDPPPESNKEPSKPKAAAISPGRVSVDEDNSLLSTLKGMTVMVDPSFRVEVIPLIRDLYKVNPDMGIALQDMFKLANTGHTVTFPNNSDAEADKMRNHLIN